MIIEIDNFADAQAFRELAFSKDFYDFDAPDGETYKRVQIVELPEITKKLEQILGPIQMLGTGFRLNYNGELPNRAIHSDLGWGTHALVLYLSEGPGGTAFWQHKKTGAKSIKAGQQDLLELIEGDWDSPDKWEQVYLCEGKPGKAVIYPSELFHSRWPFAAYGDSPENGRLIAVAFFNKVPDVPTIRHATEEDLPELLRMSEHFYPMTGYNEFAPFNKDTVESLILGLIQNHILVVGELNNHICGFAGAIVAPWLFNTEVKAAHEVILWVDEFARGSKLGMHLLVALETLAVEKGAVTLQMVHFTHIKGAEKLYTSLGYTHTESTYFKRL